MGEDIQGEEAGGEGEGMTWDGPEIICRAPLDALYNQPNRCGCPKCQPQGTDRVIQPHDNAGVAEKQTSDKLSACPAPKIT